MAQINCLMCHGSQYVCCHRRIVSFSGQLHRYREIMLGSCLCTVVKCHPAREVGQFAGSAEHLTAHPVIGEGATKVTGHVRGQVLHDGGTCMAVAATLVHLREE